MRQNKIKHLFNPLEALLKFLSALGVKNVIIGGIAASLLGKTRFTADIDGLIFLSDKELENFLKKAGNYGLLPRIKNVLEFVQKNRVILLKHKDSGINIDLSLGLIPFEFEVLNHAHPFKIGNIVLYLPTPEDLIIMKAVAHRPQDLEDIRSILEVNLNIDFKRIKYWVKEFAKVLEMPEIFDDLKKLISHAGG
ncbi:hypothetical protein AUJ66_03915 [Candidatus Desantisbacteria bacterium CG1_02_38_46]|uniref:DUF6036 domain-containing protein n=3 Tax=unclassified Candidatus Desantisiibacteriota TaxID=3106372 RepID=A0A2H9PAS0_9BACT|nr:MAG: hypothetical protein AUJ66_03915 [Candidatus Desantisbacteria bacterium CG1_02_38_46]PIU51456.1 MAG: hypothetical protein COS91_04365 [Candidatus Desantisbacteria bacterium CG07_land_8_20_14_0_80_39_15]PIZ15655.1 MAG: hypothetical protein COY51_04680 [Candidatus Desantisbacteria bacterium CG_4_10_14_0_8_um_filter_39_17]